MFCKQKDLCSPRMGVTAFSGGVHACTIINTYELQFSGVCDMAQLRMRWTINQFLFVVYLLMVNF